MNEQNRGESHNDTIRAASDPVKLVQASIELAESVREERLSRISMLRQLRTRFPDRSEEELTAVMHEALQQVLGGTQ